MYQYMTCAHDRLQRKHTTARVHLGILSILFVTETYSRCPFDVNSYSYFCYVILDASVTRDLVADRCSVFGGLPVWFSDDAEISWLQNLLAAHSIDCIHLGMYTHHYKVFERHSVLLTKTVRWTV